MQFEVLFEVAHHQVTSLMDAYKPSEVMMIAAMMQALTVKAARMQDPEGMIDSLPALVRQLRDSTEEADPPTRNH
jgi:hypothetical protein